MFRRYCAANLREIIQAVKFGTYFILIYINFNMFYL